MQPLSAQVQVLLLLLLLLMGQLRLSAWSCTLRGRGWRCYLHLCVPLALQGAPALRVPPGLPAALVAAAAAVVFSAVCLVAARTRTRRREPTMQAMGLRLQRCL